VIVAVVATSVVSSCGNDHNRSRQVGVSGDDGTGAVGTVPSPDAPVPTSTTSVVPSTTLSTLSSKDGANYNSGGSRSGVPAQTSTTLVVASGSPRLGPGHGAYVAVFCSTASECVAAGAGPNGSGVVGVTTDAGKSWQAGSLPSATPSLSSVACADTQHCMAVGQDSIVVTSNGGASWVDRVVPSPAGTNLLGVACNTAGDCIAVGTSPNPTGPYLPQMVRSADKGSDWTTIKLPSGLYGLGTVACPTPQFCAAVGGSLVVSNDGGQTWAERYVNGGMQGLSSISCVNGLRCIAVGANPAEMSNPSAPAEGITTTDGGITWSAINPNSGSGTTQSVSCSPSGTCVAGGPPAGSPASFEMSSSNGSWTSASPPGGMTDIAGLDCHIAGMWMAVGHIGNQPATATTFNYGATWIATALPYS
jgi:photosystem II stability/assembly factor-like uncharacterized protein